MDTISTVHNVQQVTSLIMSPIVKLAAHLYPIAIAVHPIIQQALTAMSVP